MVLAAGLGTRLKPFTDRIPKPLIPLHGVPCMEYALLSLSEAGVREGVVNVHAHPELMRAYLAGRPASPLALRESDETNLLLGSAGGIRKMFDVLGEGPVFSFNADVLHLVPLRLLQARHEELRAKYGVWMTLVLASSGNYREILFDPGTGLVTGFGEKKPGVPYFTGTAVFERDGFEHLHSGVPAEFVPEVLTPAIEAGKVGFLLSDALWLDVGTPGLWHQAELRIRDELRSGSLPGYMMDRLRRSDPGLGGRFELGKSSIRMDDMLYEIEDLRNS
jgi:MurNAc alpha-1-phosphate uridylyltransferase